MNCFAAFFIINYKDFSIQSETERERERQEKAKDKFVVCAAASRRFGVFEARTTSN